MIAVVAKLPIKDGMVDQAIQAVKDFMVHVSTEKGTLGYTLNSDKNNPNVLTIIERYQDKDALKAHGAAPEFGEFFQKAAPMLAGDPEMTIYKELHSI
jgi:quinol monooxygenase YgiN